MVWNNDLTRRYTLSDLFFIALLILPFMDTLNGLLNNGGNGGWISLGIIYRSLFLFICISLLVHSGVSRRSQIVFVALAACIVLPHFFDFFYNEAAGSATTFSSAWLKGILPIVCIEAFYSYSRKMGKHFFSVEKLFRAWSLLFPLCVFVPLVFGLGFTTHGNAAGYKGFFFSQNDLGFVLVGLFAYTMYRLTTKMTLYDVLCGMLLLASALILGLKSCYMLVLLIAAYYLVSSKSIDLTKKIAFLLAFLLILSTIFIVFSDKLEQIFARWEYMFQLLGDPITFASSGRVDRIPTAANFLDSTYGNSSWLIFGSGFEYTEAIERYKIVEIDLADIFFNYGIVGSLFYVIYYGYVFIESQRKERSVSYLRIDFIIAILMAMSAGHVLFNSSLSGMMFATICIGLMSDAKLSNRTKRRPCVESMVQSMQGKLFLPLKSDS